MSEATEPATQTTTPPKPRSYAWVWAFFTLVLVVCAGAGGAVYLEHRIGQFAYAIQQAEAEREIQAQPTTTALRMLSSLQTRVKGMEESLEKNDATFTEQAEKLAALEEKPEADTSELTSLKEELATTNEALTALQETVKKQAVPAAAYGEALRQFLQVKQRLGTKHTQADLDAFKIALDAIAIDPKQLTRRASIAENIGHIEAAISQGMHTRTALIASLHEATASLEPLSIAAPDANAPDEDPSSDFWQRLMAFSKRHVRIEPEASAQAREQITALNAFEAHDDVLGAARTIAQMDQVPEALRDWQASAKHYLAAERALTRIEEDLANLTQDS